MKAALQNAGYLIESERVENSDSMKAALSKHPWDIILSGYNLSHLNALAALNLAREMDQYIPFIIVSGTIGEETAVAATKAGANDCIMKDHLQRLAHAVDRCLRDAAARNESKRAQDLLVKSQALLNNALKMVHLGHWEYDVHNDLFTFNDQFYSIFRTKADMVGGYTMTSADYARRFIFPADIRKVKIESRIAIATKNPNFIKQFKHRMLYSDGSVGILSIRFSIIKDEHGDTIKVYGVMQDITELVQTYESLRENEEKYRSLFNNSLDAILLTKPEGTILDANPAACKMFRYSEDEIKRVGRLGLVDIDDPRLHATLKNRELNGHATAEITMVRSDGTTFPAEIASSIFLDAKGKQKSSMIIRDITDRKKAEEEIRALNAELEERVLRRTAELTMANKELEAFSYSVSHDLRAPLRSIEGFSQIFLNEYGATIPERGCEYLERVRHNALRMGQLIDDMLELSRISRSEIHAQKIDVSALASEIAEELAAENPKRDLRADIEPGMAVVADPQLLRIVLANLLGNAWKFTLKRERAHVSMGTVIDPVHGPAFFVRDNGIGFDNRYRDKLFVAFQRLHSGQEFPGTGIGLANVQRVVRRHGGEVWAEGEVGRGATFYFSVLKK